MFAKCKVMACKENHSKHYCKICKIPDSNHFSSNCSKNKNLSPHCQVNGCKESHNKHHCNHCDNNDSDHFAKDCPVKSQNCKVPGCQKKHTKHYCRFCENLNSNHYAKDCPKSIELYHATKLSCLEMPGGIGKIGLQPQSNNTRFGSGIYFAEKEIAEELAENLYSIEGALLKCKVYLGNCKDYMNQIDNSGVWMNSYDSITAIHPPWFGGKTSTNFREWCIKSAKKCKIYSITYKKKEFRMEDYKKKPRILDIIKNT